jgi:membrane-associated phospholipid phosphatase
MYVRYHLYGFHPLHANLHNSAFPSGHAIGAVGIVTVLWIMTPRFRIPSVLLAAAVMSAMLVKNAHWLSDMFAGAFLGLSIGWMTVRLQSDIAANGGKTR